MSQKNRRELEPYEPDYSPAYRESTPPPPPRPSVGIFGCLRDSLAIVVLGVVVLAMLGGAYWYLAVRETADTTENIFESIFGSGDQVTNVDVRQIILAVRQEAWLETVRETHYVEVSADIAMPSPLPGRRSMKYGAFVTVTAGMDLELLADDHFRVEGDTVIITLPNAQTKDCILDEDASRYFDRNCSIVGCGNLEDILRQEALKTAAMYEIERLHQEAFENAAEYLQELGQNLGFEQVEIERDGQTLEPVAKGGTCQIAIISPTPTPDMSSE